MSHQTIIYDTKLLPISAKTVGADKIIDVSKRIEMNSPNIIRNLSEEKFFVQGKIILQIIYEEKTELNSVKVFQIDIPFISLISNITNPSVPITASFAQFSVELINEYTIGVSYILLIAAAMELDEPRIEPNENSEIQDIDSMENKILKLEIKDDKEQIEQIDSVEQIEKMVVHKITNTPTHSPNNPDTVFLTSEDYTAVKKHQKERNIEWKIPPSTKTKSKSKVTSKPRKEQKPAKRKEQPLNNNYYKPFLTLKESKATLSFKNLSNK